MIEIIAGSKGKGKTKVLMQDVHNEIKNTQGTMVYLDKNNKQMYELTRDVRLIVVPEFDIKGTDMFIGFIAGILSQDHDLDRVYLDSFLTIADITDNIEYAIERLNVLSERFDVNFVLSVSEDKKDLPESLQALVKVAL